MDIYILQGSVST